jgi:hypothetical protein
VNGGAVEVFPSWFLLCAILCVLLSVDVCLEDFFAFKWGGNS